MNILTTIRTGLVGVLLLFSFTAFGQQSVFSEDGPSDPEQAKIFKELASELRCLVCQNQNIADSNAPLAQDLRRQIHEMLDRGENKKQILDFMVQRYGEFILYRPLFSAKTLFLWLGPLLFFIIGLFLVWRMARKPKAPAFEPDAASLAQARELLSADQNKDQTP